MAAPDKPRLVIRISFAGSRRIDDADKLSARLDAVYARAAEIIAAAAATAHEFYDASPPVLRLTTGLAEGGDLIAARCFRLPEKGLAEPSIERQSAAILPFDRRVYRLTLDVAVQQTFDEELAAGGEFVVELDGRYLADGACPQGKTATFCRYVRTRAYRGQATVLLRQCDLLLAAYDPAAIPKPAGTVETIRNALELGIPVVLIPLGAEAGADDVAILHQRDGFQEYCPTPTPEWRKELGDLLEQLVIAPPILRAKRKAHELSVQRSDESLGLVHDYFSSTPRLTRFAGIRQRSWAWFEGRFITPPVGKQVAPAAGSTPATGIAGSPATPHVPPDSVKPYRDRAAALARHYAGVYRGTFFMSYVLAVIAIFIAIVGLCLLLTGDWPGKEWVLFALAFTKLLILGAIFYFIEDANHHDFNGKGIDYRYLAERLRTQPFLMMAGSSRPPTPATIRHAARADRLTVIEWLFQAVVRQADLGQAPAPIDPENCLKELKSRWLDVQAKHHEENAAKMELMHHFIEKLARMMGVAVIVFVVFDLGIILLHLLGWPSGVRLRSADIALKFLAVPLTALLPAAVASLNGIRFQSECDRLAERSKVMSKLIAERSTEAQKLVDRIGQARSRPDDDQRGWDSDCLLFAESCARIMADEVADWSVLYSKNVFDV